jgi:hypothetical protein
MAFTNGRFRARPTVHGPAKSPNGHPQYAIEFELLEGDDAGKAITFFGGLTGGGFDFTSKVLRTCGWSGEGDPRDATLDREVALTIADETHNGKTNAKVKYVDDPDAPPPATTSLVERNAMPKAEADAFMKEFLARTKGGKAAATPPAQQPAFRTIAGGKPAAAPSPAAQPATPAQPDLGSDPGADDDIPF